MSSPSIIGNLAARALARLPQQFKGKSNLQALIEATIAPLQELENVADDLYVLRWLRIAEGAQLDGMGSIVGERRLGRDDDAYRAAIFFRIAMNCSKGTPENLINALLVLTESTQIIYIERWPAKVQLVGNGSAAPLLLHEIMEATAPIGVGIDEILLTYGKTPFSFLTEFGPQRGLGFAELGYATGGHLSEKV